MNISWTAIMAAGLAPVLIRWSLSLANKPSADQRHFRPVPPLRALYPSGIIIFGWGAAFCLKEIVRPTEYQSGSATPWVGLALSIFFLVSTIASWPSTVVVEDGGLSFRRLFRQRRALRWEEIEDVAVSMDGGLVIYDKVGKQFEVSSYNEGRYELKNIVNQRIHRTMP